MSAHIKEGAGDGKREAIGAVAQARLWNQSGSPQVKPSTRRKVDGRLHRIDPDPDTPGKSGLRQSARPEEALWKQF
jgi:hypothetical protein